jgi:hypothetical protein
MAGTNPRKRVGFVAAVAAGVLTAGCSHFSAMHWPWTHKAPPPPEPVNELTVSTASGTPAAYPQYWKRNTLLIDLHDVTQEGGITVQPHAGGQWPVRIAFRVTPGSIGVLEVRGEERMVLPVAQAGAAPVDLELAPGIYISTTVQLKVHWSAR